MGFFDIVKGVIGLGARVLGITPAARALAAPVARAVAPAAVSPIRRIAARGLGLAAGGAAFAAGDIALQAAIGDDGPMPLAAGGNGRFNTFTVVITRDEEGTVIRRKVLAGSPFLMNRDLSIAKRVDRVLGKKARALAARGRKPSKRSQLLDAVEDKAIRSALGVDCPAPVVLGHHTAHG